jgi:hypothetical protein
VQAYLLETGKLAAERVFLVSPKLPEPGSTDTARVTFTLN